MPDARTGTVAAETLLLSADFSTSEALDAEMVHEDRDSTPASRTRSSIGAVRNPESHEAILAAAEELIEEHGYRRFTLDAVVKRAGSSKPTIYRRWRNKGALIMEVYERSGEAALQAPDTGDLRGDLVGYLTSLWTWWRTSASGEVLRSFITEAQLEPDSVAELRDHFLPRRKKTFDPIIARAVARGDLKAGPAIDAAITMLVGVSWLHLLTDTLAATDTIERYVAISLRGAVTDI